MSGTRLRPTPSYLDLLRAAYALGRVDGLLAADFEPLEGAGPSIACCRGRDPADLARHLWDVRAKVYPRGSRSTLRVGTHAASKSPVRSPGR